MLKANPILLLSVRFQSEYQKSSVWVGIAIAERRYSRDLIKKQGEFTRESTYSKMVNEVLGCGRCSGRDGIDKFAKFNLTPLPSKYVKAADHCRMSGESGV